MKCPHCNQEHPEGTKFCPETGEKMPLLLSCPNSSCRNYNKYTLPLDSNYCPDCGMKLIHKDFIEKNYLDPLVISEYMGEDVSVIDDNSVIYGESSEGNRTCQFSYRNINITAIGDEGGAISKFLYKSLTFENLRVLFKLPDDVDDVVELRSTLLSIEDVDGTNFNFVDYNLRFYLRFRKDGTIRYLMVEKYRDKGFLASVFPINGVLLGETSFKQIGKKYSLRNNGGETYCNIGGIAFFSQEGSSKVCSMVIENNVEMPASLIHWGFDWHFSYSQYLEILKEKGLSPNKWGAEKPKVISKKGRSMLKATIKVSLDEFVYCSLIFDMGNKNGEGCSTSSPNSLYKIVFEYEE